MRKNPFMVDGLWLMAQGDVLFNFAFALPGLDLWLALARIGEWHDVHVAARQLERNGISAALKIVGMI